MCEKAINLSVVWSFSAWYSTTVPRKKYTKKYISTDKKESKEVAKQTAITKGRGQLENFLRLLRKSVIYL